MKFFDVIVRKYYILQHVIFIFQLITLWVTSIFAINILKCIHIYKKYITTYIKCNTIHNMKHVSLYTDGGDVDKKSVVDN